MDSLSKKFLVASYPCTIAIIMLFTGKCLWVDVVLLTTLEEKCELRKRAGNVGHIFPTDLLDRPCVILLYLSFDAGCSYILV